MFKAEGLILGLVVVSSWIGTRLVLREGEMRAPWALPGLLAFGIPACWWLLLAHLAGIDAGSVQALTFEDVSASRFVGNLERLPTIGTALVSLSPRYTLLAAAAGVASAAAAVTAPPLRAVLAWLWTASALHLAWVVGVFVLTGADLAWHLDTALLRLVSQQSCLWVVALSVSAAALLDG
jgi:hypothetical protein